MILIALISYMPIVLIHELGHLFVAKIVGFRIRLLRVGPFVMERRDGNWQARFDIKTSLTGGQVRSVPVSLDHLRFKLLFMIAGGPVASLIFALVAAMGEIAVHSSDSPSFVHAAGVSSFLSLVLFAVTTLPLSGGPHRSDGLLMLRLMRGGRGSDLLCAYYACASSFSTEVRPRDWNPAWIPSLIAGGQTAADELIGLLTAYAYSVDMGKIAEAGAYVDRARALAGSMPNEQSRTILLESSYFAARHRNETAEARLCFDQATHSLVPVESYTVLRCEAAVLVSEGRREDALRTLRTANAMMSRMTKTGDLMAERDLVHDLELRAQSLHLAESSNQNEATP